MTKWIADYWYVLWGVVGAALYIWFRMSHKSEEGTAFRRFRAILRPGQSTAESRSLTLRDVCIVVVLLLVVLVVVPYFLWE